MTPDSGAGALQLCWELQDMLAEISGMDAISLQPAAGAHGELTGDEDDPRLSPRSRRHAQHGAHSGQRPRHEPGERRAGGYKVVQLEGNSSAWSRSARCGAP
jgi:glycine dehydrogenase subunit 2